MREWLARLQPALTKKNLLVVAVLAGVGIGAFFWGRHNARATPLALPEANANGGEGYRGGNRIVAYVNGQPVYREELGEYLIARFGADRLDFLLNRKIVEAECKRQNIFVSDSDVEARFTMDLQAFGPQMTPAAFEANFLKRFNKTVYEWKEDVIRPKIMMERIVGPTVQIKDEDVKEGFEARYGPKVECRMIVMNKDNGAAVQKVWQDVQKSREAFLAEAAKQYMPNLANAKGLVPPIHKHFGDKELENAAFRLREGEVSGIIHMPDGVFVILMCERHIPENKTERFEDVRYKISREMQELRVAQKIPEKFVEMRKAANPQKLMKDEGSMVSVRNNEPNVPMPKLSAPGAVMLPPDEKPAAPKNLLPVPPVQEKK